MPSSRLLLGLTLFSLALAGCAGTKQQGAQVDPETRKAAKLAAKSIQPSQTSVLRSLEDRIKNPDMSMQYVPADRAYTANKTFDGKPAYVKDFYISQKTNSKAFSTKSWWGSKADPLTDKKFRTKTADTKDYRTEVYDTEKYDTKDWYMAKKAVAVDQYKTRDYAGRGTRQDVFDGSGQYNEPMTVDDVRELLNRNR